MCSAYELFFNKIWYLLNLSWAKVTLENLLKLLNTKPIVCVGLGAFYFFPVNFFPPFPFIFQINNSSSS